DEAERIDRLEPGVALAERAVVEEHLEPRLGRQPEVVAAGWADAVVLLELLVEQHVRALGALRPQVRGIRITPGPEGGQLDRHRSGARARLAHRVGGAD